MMTRFLALVAYFRGHVPAARVPLPEAHPAPADKGGAVLRTIGDVRAYMIAMPAAHDGCARWLHAAKLILGQADVAAVSRQVYLALFYDAQLDIGAMD